MRRMCFLSLVLLPLFLMLGAASDVATEQTSIRFVPLHIYLDSGEHEVAAYQFELKVARGDVKIVGVEGGDHFAFRNAPYYDSAALSQNRIIIAAFSTDKALPTGRTRIATLHLQVIGDVTPGYELELTVSANAEGKPITTTITFEQGELK